MEPWATQQCRGNVMQIFRIAVAASIPQGLLVASTTCPYGHWALVVDLMFCVACLATGKFVIGLDTDTLRTLTVITLVFSGQALFYVARKKATPLELAAGAMARFVLGHRCCSHQRPGFEQDS
jgi:hypothetical protein